MNEEETSHVSIWINIEFGKPVFFEYPKYLEGLESDELDDEVTMWYKFASMEKSSNLQNRLYKDMEDIKHVLFVSIVHLILRQGVKLSTLWYVPDLCSSMFISKEFLNELFSKNPNLETFAWIC
ncbi:4688_t:CDS:1 [Funneliformis mosseae]|uniref:4688_t:CDS:1 n=1 Tax=Funneliformis mosseae TaxID=27381 RepID=A0A9N9BPP5_FUNMO|nr:4688_t:CDS:1 [Funneliformis mosseae]